MASAIMTKMKEGVYHSCLGKTNKPRGYRNNNPLNIRYSDRNPWQGKIPAERNTDADCEFEQFENLLYGYRAAMILIYNYTQTGCTTIKQIIQRWAPESENDTDGYVKSVRIHSGLDTNYPFDPLYKQHMMRLLRAMTIVENGIYDAKYEEDMEDAWVMYYNQVKNGYVYGQKKGRNKHESLGM